MLERAEKIYKEHGFVFLICEPRVGKTLPALHLNKDNTSVLVLTKKNAITGWEDSIKAMRSKTDCFFDVTNYEQIHNKRSFDYNAIILDESHNKLSAFPKKSQTLKQVKQFCSLKKITYITATPQAETTCQFFHQLWLCDNSPYRKYTTFYKWFKDYGIPSPIYVAGRLQETYKKCKSEKILQELDQYFVKMSQEDAGFDVNANDVILTITNDEVFKIHNDFKKNKMMEFRGYSIVAESAAELLIRLHQICGGVVYSKDPEMQLTLSLYKVMYLRSVYPAFRTMRKIVVLCNYIHERKILLENLMNSTDDVERFKKEPQLKYFIGNVKAYSEGVDFSYADAMVIYSMNFSATTYIQVRNRMCNKNREEPANIYYLMLEGGIDRYIYDTVKQKENFNTKIFYNIEGEQC